MLPRPVILVLLAAVASPGVAAGQWMPEGNPVSRAPSGQYPYAMLSGAISPGVGQTLVVWHDLRSFATTGYDLYYKSVASTGLMDPGDGTPLCVLPGTQALPAAARTGPWTGHTSGISAMVVAWEDGRPGSAGLDIYAQRIGAPAGWANNGLPVCVAAGDQVDPVIVGDPDGRAIVAWVDGRGDGDVYAQKLDLNGAPLWAPNGIPIGTAPGQQDQLRMVPDGSGGALLVWRDLGFDSAIYALRLLGNGTVAPGWTPNGTRVCDSPAAQTHAEIAADGAGGLLVAFCDGREGGWSDVYAMRLDGAGQPAPGWPLEGVAVCTGTSQPPIAILPQGDRGGIVVWPDGRNTPPLGSDVEVYALRLTGSGQVAPGWEVAGGRRVAREVDPQYRPRAVTRGQSGFLVTWVRFDGKTTPRDVYAGALDAIGQVPVPWPADGVRVCGAAQDQTDVLAVTDGGAGALVAWGDARDEGLNGVDIYATSVNGSGQVEVPRAIASALRLGAARPNPSRGATTFALELPESRAVRATVVDVAGRELGVLADGMLPAGHHALSWSPGASAGVHFLVVRAGSERLSRRFVTLRAAP